MCHSFRQSTDGQGWVYGKGGGDEGAICHVQVGVSPDFTLVIHDAVFRTSTHVAATQWVSGEELSQGPVPEESAHVSSLDAVAQLLQALFHLPIHPPTIAVAPIDVDGPVLQPESSVCGVRPHPEKRQHTCRHSPLKEPVRFELDTACS